MTSPAPTTAPSRAEEREALQAVLASPGIARSTNLVRLLTFISEKYFEGRSEEIRETTIAIQALGRRAEDFDSQADPIVRVTARTLRKRLEELYQREGLDHPVRILLPTGQYVPQFVRRSVPPASVPQQPRSRFALPAATVLCLLAGYGLGRWSGHPALVAPTTPCPCGIWGSPAWSDEFDGPQGAAPDPARWTFDVGNNDGWGNAELQTYCAPGSAEPPCDPKAPNAFQDGDGHLVLAALQGPGGRWTSARLKTRPGAELRYGRIEARMRLPQGPGLWSSFWLLGADIEKVGWPECGSISVMENVPMRPATNGLGPYMVRSTIHGPGYFGGNGMWQNYTLPDGARVDDEYQVYGAIWSPQMIQFYAGDPENVFFVRTAADLPTGGRWAFDHPFTLLLSLAVGGQWPGPPDETTPSPARMSIDYVRVYAASRVAGPAMEVAPLSLDAGGTATGNLTLRGTSGTPRIALTCTGTPPGVTCGLNPPVVDFSRTASQTATLTVTAASRLVAAPGRHSLHVQALTVSGDTSRVEVPLTIHGGPR